MKGDKFMPKGRRNTISRINSISGAVSSLATESSGSLVGRNEELTAESINNRLQNNRDVTLQIPSRTRGQTEDVQVRFIEPGNAQVSSASGNTYDVDYEHGTCTCMHYRMRGERCRHIDAVDIAMGQATESNINSENSNIISERERQDIVEEENRERLFQDQEDDGFFYLDNMSEFNEKLSEGVDVDYEYENVLNGSDVTFGVEIEFVGGNADAIARDLYNEGICAYDRRVRYHAESISGMWKLERDGSVSDGSGGGEIVSPVLKDEPSTWRNIEKICEIAERHGARVNGSCGGHVHIGMDPLDTARQRWRRFFKIINGYEECMYRAAGGEFGRVRSGHNHYAMPFHDRASIGVGGRITLQDENDVSNLARRISEGDRYYGINLTNISSYNKPDTVEFRYYNGSLNAKQIQANIKLSAGIMMAAKKCRTKDIESINYIVSNTFKRRGRMVNKYNESDSRSNTKIAELLDIVFTRKKDKDALLNVFAKNDWR